MIMRHITIDYGIDLGTTNSAICRVEQGVPQIIRSDAGQETAPSCVSFRKGGVIRVGQSAYDDLGRDKLRALKKRSAMASNSCIEFKRFMGTDMKYSNANVDHQWSPEELSAEVLRSLCSYVTDDVVEAAVITVPAKFTVNQKSATLEAARLAGIRQVELLQEPIAASMAYGLTAQEQNGTWMVFDFGGGTLDVALVRVSDGIMQVFDTEGDNYLGGKNIDELVVSRLLLPQIARHYTLNFSDEEQKMLMVEALKVVAEKLKNKLSYCESETIYLEAGEWGEDEDGEEIEMEMTVTRAEFETVVRPILQKAVDVCKAIMLRNNIPYGKLSHLILVGGPTYIPLLRKMLREQVTENVETGINPMTAVATGAAIYASTIQLESDDEDLDDDMVQLSLDFDPITIDAHPLIPVRAKQYRNGLSVRAVRKSDGVESAEVNIKETGSLLEIDLIAGQPNIFRLVASVEGVSVRCYPSEITIVHGTKAGTAILPYNIGMEVFNPKKNKNVFAAFSGLEKNRPLPAVGTVYGLKTMTDLKPGIATDVMRVTVYQGDEKSEGKTAALYEHVSDVVISGDDIVSFIPKGSMLNIRVEVDRSEMMSIMVEFPTSGQKIQKQLDASRKQETKDKEYLKNLVGQATAQLNSLKNDIEDVSESIRIENQINQVNDALDSGAQPKQVEQHLKEVLRALEDYEMSTEWDRECNRLKRTQQTLCISVAGKDDPGIIKMCENFAKQVEHAVILKDLLTAKTLRTQIDNYRYSVMQPEIYRNFIYSVERDFCFMKWRDPLAAEQLIATGIRILKEDPEAPLSKTRDIVDEIWALIERDVVAEDNQMWRWDLPSM